MRMETAAGSNINGGRFHGNQRVGGDYRSGTACRHWLAGRCTRNPCPFFHPVESQPRPDNNSFSSSITSTRGTHQPSNGGRGGSRGLVWRKPNSDVGPPASSNRWDKDLPGGTRSPKVVSDSSDDDSFSSSSITSSRGTQQPSNGGSRRLVLRKPNSDLGPASSNRCGKGHPGGTRTPKVVPDSSDGNRICKYFLSGSCKYGDRCQFLHSFVSGDAFALLTTLEGQQKVITGITLPSGSDKLYSGSKDESVRVWDCHTGQCSGTINMGGEVGCIISEGPWIFVGVPYAVKAWNTETSAEMSLPGPTGQVYSLVVGLEMLFAGIHDGNILAWKFSAAANCFEPAASLSGHTLAVVSMVVGANRLYSGSMDHTIRVWDLTTLQCIQTLTDHTSVVMSVLCWDQFLLSCSLDQTVKVWAATENGSIEVTHTHSEDHGVLALCGMHDAEAKPVLFCSCNDNSVRVYDLPSFSERGKIFSKEEVRSIQVGPGGLFFTGDATGKLKVWKWAVNDTPTASDR